MRSFRFSLSQLLFVVALFPLAVGVAAASSFGAFIAHDVLGQSLAQLLRNVIDSGFYVHVLTHDVTDFIGTTLALAAVVAALTTSRLGPVRHFASLVVLAVPMFIGIQEYFLTRDDRKGSFLQQLQEYFYYRWDVIVVAAGIMGVLWWVRSRIARSRPGTLSIRDWQATASIGAKALTGSLLVATLSIAAVGFLWLRDLSLMGC